MSGPNGDAGVAQVGEGAWEREVLALMLKHFHPEEIEVLTYEHGPYSITKVCNSMMTFASAIALSRRAGNTTGTVMTAHEVAVAWQKAMTDRQQNRDLPDFSLPASVLPDHRIGGGHTLVPDGIAQKCIRQDCSCSDAWHRSRPPILEPASSVEGKELVQVAKLAWTAVTSAAEWDDRTSPEGYEEYLFFKPDELHQILVSFFETVTDPDRRPSPAVSAEVTDAMVERACRVQHVGWSLWHEPQKKTAREVMRAALTAALLAFRKEGE